jgi:hypothetical protein
LLYIVPKADVKRPRERRKRKPFRRGARMKIAGGMFVVLALGGAAAVCWSIW